jgi:oxygen-independent coproporphyrinogen III oxidase
LGIYIHIPFCKKACTYCNFYFSTNLKAYPTFITALLNEIALTQHPSNTNINTIYFGGGTPSLMQHADIAAILQALRNKYNVSTTAEITLECNPDDINKNNLQQWLQIGINRLSVGLQSFNNQELVWMNRTHNAEEAIAALQLLPQMGFTNYSIDLIYGSPFLSNTDWEATLDTLIAHNVPHVSCYALTVEEKTKLANDIAKKIIPPIDDDLQTQHFEILLQKLQAASYEQYEISSFSKIGYRSKHNSSYWYGASYLGLGPSAHSFDGNNKRWWNIANNALYIATLNNNELPIAETEHLSEVARMNETIMIGLRTIEGIDLIKFKQNFGVANFEKLLKNLHAAIPNGQIIITDDFARIPVAKMFFADGIAAGLFF